MASPEGSDSEEVLFVRTKCGPNMYGHNGQGQESVKRRPCGRLGEGGRGEQDSGEVGASQGRLIIAPYYSMASPAVAWRASSTALKGQTQGYQRRGRFISNLTVRDECARCSQKKSTFATERRTSRRR